MMRITIGLTALLAVLAQPAFAHTGVTGVSGFMAGFGHPVGGLDHLLAMVAVGILAAQQGGRSVWLVPVTFVAAMAAGGALGVVGAPVPFVEQGIVGSVVILGAVIAFGRRLPVVSAMAMVGVFALFHGHAHGTEMPMNASGLEYGLGFAIATAMLHGLGLGAASGAQRLVDRIAPIALRVSGGAIAAAGIGLAVL